jgi:hypothetical protein
MQGLITGLLTFAVYFSAQAAVFHWIKVVRRALTLVGLWFLCLFLYFLLFRWIPEDTAPWPPSLAAPSDAVTLMSGLLLYFFLFMGYAQFFYIAESSVGVRTMIELNTEPERGLTLDELTERYRYDWMLERRLKRLIHAGYLIEEDGWYRTTLRGRIAALILSRWKESLRLGPGG